MIYAVIAVYFGLLLWLGILASRRVKSISDYYVGGKQVGYWVAAFSARARCSASRAKISSGV